MIINMMIIMNSKASIEIQNKIVSMKLSSWQSASDIEVEGVNLNSICHHLCGVHLPEGELASHTTSS